MPRETEYVPDVAGALMLLNSAKKCPAPIRTPAIDDLQHLGVQAAVVCEPVADQLLRAGTAFEFGPASSQNVGKPCFAGDDLLKMGREETLLQALRLYPEIAREMLVPAASLRMAENDDAIEIKNENHARLCHSASAIASSL